MYAYIYTVYDVCHRGVLFPLLCDAALTAAIPGTPDFILGSTVVVHEKCRDIGTQNFTAKKVSCAYISRYSYHRLTVVQFFKSFVALRNNSFT